MLMRDVSYEVRGARWQSIDVSDKPEMRMREILNHCFSVVLDNRAMSLAEDIRPNLPWVEDHFKERVGGAPLNPGKQWRNWPWALAADKHRVENTGFENMFSHTYMERYWPKFANDLGHELAGSQQYINPRRGVRYEYGDLDDVVNHLLGDPLSRQAYLPVWFPEDTGVVHGQRVPCSLGYHWILRNGYLHTTYYIRSCDFVRHFRDDLYLSVCLTQWMLERLREREEASLMEENLQPIDLESWVWRNTRLGLFTFNCVSMHMFYGDWVRIYGPGAKKTS